MYIVLFSGKMDKQGACPHLRFKRCVVQRQAFDERYAHNDATFEIRLFLFKEFVIFFINSCL